MVYVCIRQHFLENSNESADLPMLNVANYMHLSYSFGPRVSHKLSQATVTVMYHFILASKHGHTFVGE